MFRRIKEIAKMEKTKMRCNTMKIKYEAQMEELLEAKDEIIELQKKQLNRNDKYRKILEKLSEIEMKLDKGGKNNGSKVSTFKGK